MPALSSTHTHTHTHACTHTHKQTHTQTNTHTHKHKHTQMATINTNTQSSVMFHRALREKPGRNVSPLAFLKIHRKKYTSLSPPTPFPPKHLVISINNSYLIHTSRDVITERSSSLNLNGFKLLQQFITAFNFHMELPVMNQS